MARKETVGPRGGLVACSYRPKRSRLDTIIRPSDVARMVCACRKHGFEWPQIKAAVAKKCVVVELECECQTVKNALLEALTMLAAVAISIVVLQVLVRVLPALLSVLAISAPVLRVLAYVAPQLTATLTRSAPMLESTLASSRTILPQIEYQAGRTLEAIQVGLKTYHVL